VIQIEGPTSHFPRNFDIVPVGPDKPASLAVRDLNLNGKYQKEVYHVDELSVTEVTIKLGLFGVESYTSTCTLLVPFTTNAARVH
jgi:hypothetical protein